MVYKQISAILNNFDIDPEISDELADHLSFEELDELKYITDVHIMTVQYGNKQCLHNDYRNINEMVNSGELELSDFYRYGKNGNFNPLNDPSFYFKKYGDF